jgi:hypothetical protein
MKPGEADHGIAALLPFWVNGTLTSDEAAAVEAAVAADPALAKEVVFLQAVRSQMQTIQPGYSPGEIGLARLKRAITAQPDAAPARRDVPLRLVVAATVVAAMVGFAANETLRGPQPAEYVQASGGADVPALVVAFQGNATSQAISDFLLAKGLVILDGPSAIGLYRIAPTDAVDLAGLAEQLQARSDLFDVVDLAE